MGIFYDINGNGVVDYVRTHSSHQNHTYINILEGSFCGMESCRWARRVEWDAPFDLFSGNGARGVIGNYGPDGRPEVLISVQGGSNEIFMMRGPGFSFEEKASDLLRAIESPMAPRIHISYTTLLDEVHYSTGQSIYPYQSISSNVVIVSEIDAGVGRQRYLYEDLQAHALGRGLLGFRKVSSENLDTGHKIDLTYAQKFPFTGMVESSVRSWGIAPWQYNLLEKTNNVLDVKAFTPEGGGVRYFPYYAVRNSESFGNLASSQPTVIEEVLFEYDDFGNEVQVEFRRRPGGGFGTLHKILTNRSYVNNLELWHIGLLEQEVITNTNPDGEALSRTNFYEHDTQVGLLTSEILEPYEPTLYSRRDYSYDQYGNQVGVVVTAQNVAPRVTEAVWDERGRFRRQVINAMGHVTAYVYGAAYGELERQTDANGLITSFTYDSFGRRTGEFIDQPGLQKSVIIERGWCVNGFPVFCEIEDGHFRRKTGSDGSDSVHVFDRRGAEVAYVWQVPHRATGVWGVIRKEYDLQGRLISETVPAYFWDDVEVRKTYIYDVLNRLVLEGTGPSDLYDQSYIAYGDLTVTLYDPLGHSTTEYKDAVGNVVKVVDAMGGGTLS
jgi:YD repeat-containing protein